MLISTKSVPDILKYQFTKEFVDTHKDVYFSDFCCKKFKKEIFKDFEKETGYVYSFTGMRRDEGGMRTQLNCIDGNHINILAPEEITDAWEWWFIEKYKLDMCKLYYPPYNFKRTGCIGCPYNKYLQEELLSLKKNSPKDYKHALILWKPVYDEYNRIGYRLNYECLENEQLTIFDFIDKKED